MFLSNPIKTSPHVHMNVYIFQQKGFSYNGATMQQQKHDWWKRSMNLSFSFFRALTGFGVCKSSFFPFVLALDRSCYYCHQHSHDFDLVTDQSRQMTRRPVNGCLTFPQSLGQHPKWK
jgi:hypothetical protein